MPKQTIIFELQNISLFDDTAVEKLHYANVVREILHATFVKWSSRNMRLTTKVMRHFYVEYYKRKRIFKHNY